MKYQVSSFKFQGGGRGRRARGVAMLLVMIALMVCMVLVTGFLSGQGTANGISRNESEYIRAQRAAEAGVNMCMSLIKNNSTWRSNMAPGTWFDKVNVGSAVVTVTAADNSGANSFLADPTKSVTFTSTGTYNGRVSKLLATAQPTGGGTVFYGGSFFQGAITLDKWSKMDSYNSSNGVYSALFNSGSNALASTAASANGSVQIKDFAQLNGSLVVGVGASLTNIISLALGLLFPSNVTAATEPRTAGETIPPNTTGLATRSTVTYQGSSTAGPSSGVYPSITINAAVPATNILMNTGAVVHVTGNMTVNANTKMSVGANTRVTFMVDGNVTWAGTLVMGAGSNVLFVVGGNFTQTGGAMNVTAGLVANSPNMLTVMSEKTAGGVTIKGSSSYYGTVFSPQSDIVLQDTAQAYGAMAGGTMKITDTARLHWDDAVKGKSLGNVTNGSAPPGTPNYLVTYQWNPGN